MKIDRFENSDLAQLNPKLNFSALVTELCKEGSHLLPSFGDVLDSAVEKTFELSGGLGVDSKPTTCAVSVLQYLNLCLCTL